MRNKVSIIALAVFTFGLASAPRASAGTDMIIDNSAQAPAPRYNYAPPPPVYYAPPPPVVIYPAVGFYRPFRVFAPHRVFVRRFHRPFRHW
jgi:hypothetical protein